ncbi:MAG: serine/threonine protein kinase [Phycisphaerales bacterium]|nr:MAG: serine/threonine protein kinase [Phycisphaerales bacterium]
MIHRPAAQADDLAGEPDPALPDRLDTALEALWRGSGDALADVLASSGDAGPGHVGLVRAVSRLSGLMPGVGSPPSVDGYEILGEVGRGGMGVVYRARQRSPSRDVAIKVMRRGRSGAAHLRRFRYEADSLASLDHPCIAKIFHAGVVEDADDLTPYLVMEFIEGRPLTAHLRERSSSHRARVALLARIADAVHHAHQRGVIHRDLKPDNILVDAEGTPRVLDFGVARSLEHAAEPITQDNGEASLVGTLAYMSPEQVDAEVGALDVRSDVYALGVLLYESLAGTLPYKIDRASPAEVIRQIARGGPFDWPATDPPVDAELRDIVAMATARRPADRYPSAEAFGADLRRYLAREPVRARPRGAWYVAQKFAQRQAGLVIGSGVALAVLVGLLLTLAVLYTRSVEAREAEAEQRAVAEDELEQRTRLLSFVENMLAGIDPAAARTMDRELLRMILDQAGERVEREPDMRPSAAGALHAIIGRSYFTIGELHEARRHLRLAMELFRAHADADDPRAINAAGVLAATHQNLAEFDEAHELLDWAIDASVRTHGPTHASTLWLLDNRTNLLRLSGRLDEAEANAREVLVLRTEHTGPHEPDTFHAMVNLSGVLMEQGRYDEAEPYYIGALEGFRAAYGEDHPQTINALGNLGGFYRVTGRLDEAEPLYLESLDAHHRVLGPNHPGTLRWAHNTGFLLNQLGRTVDAIPHTTSAFEGRLRVLGASHPDTFASAYNTMFFHERTGRAAKASAHAEAAAEVARAASGQPDTSRSALLAFCALAVLETDGNLPEASAWVDEARTLLRASSEIASPGALRAARAIADSAVRLGRAHEGEADLAAFAARLEAELGAEAPATREAGEALREFRAEHGMG